ncbi:MAG: MATE family efflux transporter [Chloroflexi bacterium]|nr:MATE family efflux transporter [Chloroflexota bacterium]
MPDKRQEMLASESIGKLLFKLSLPAAVAAAVMALYNIVDTIFIGQAVGPLGIAGLTIVFPLQILTMGMGMMIGVGGASLVSRALGAGDVGKSERTLGNAIFFSFILGAIFTLVGLSNSSLWLRLVGASETILPYAKGYFDVILLGMVFRITAMGINQLIRAEGNAHVAMMSMVIGFALNIVLDAVFILALDMGVRGAAIATVLSEVVSFLYMFHYYLFRNSSLKIHLKNLVPDIGVTRDIMAIGFGPFVMTVGGSLVFTVVLRTIVTYGGDLSVAAVGMLQRAMMFINIPLMSVAQGLQPILGFSYGARRPDRALTAIRLAITAATVFSVISFIVFFFFPAPLMRIFTQDSTLISTSSHAARRLFLVAYLMGFQFVASTIFQALGKKLPTFLTSISRQILFLLPLMLVLPRFWQLDGVWLSFPIADALSFVMTLVFFLREIRELKSPDFAAKMSQAPVVPGRFGGLAAGSVPSGAKDEEQAGVDR